MTEENNAIFIRGWNTPRKLPEEIPASPVKNQAQRNRSLCGPEEFGVRQGMPEFRPVEEGVQGNLSNRKGALALSPPVKQESCTGSNPDGWNYVYKSQKYTYRTKTYSKEDKKNCNDLNASAVLVEDGVFRILFKRLLIQRIKPSQTQPDHVSEK